MQLHVQTATVRYSSGTVSYTTVTGVCARWVAGGPRPSGGEGAGATNARGRAMRAEVGGTRMRAVRMPIRGRHVMRGMWPSNGYLHTLGSREYTPNITSAPLLGAHK